MKTKKKKILNIIYIAVLSVMLLTACSQGENTDTKASNNNGGSTLSIVTSFYPMHIFTKNIVKDIPGVTVVNMTEPQTGCLHDYTLIPKDMKTLESADVLVINGADMESFMDKVIDQLPGLKVIEASKGMELIKNDDTGEINPHVWVSVTGAIEEVKNIGEQLALIDPDHAEEYDKNTDAYVKKLQALSGKMHKAIDTLPNREIVTLHEAFPYFAEEFNLDVVSVIEREPGSEPSAGELATTVTTIRELGVKAIFAEPQYSTKAADTIARETGRKVYLLDPVVTGPKDADPDAYIKTMENNLKVLEEALK